MVLLQQMLSLSFNCLTPPLSMCYIFWAMSWWPSWGGCRGGSMLQARGCSTKGSEGLRNITWNAWRWGQIEYLGISCLPGCESTAPEKRVWEKESQVVPPLRHPHRHRDEDLLAQHDLRQVYRPRHLLFHSRQGHRRDLFCATQPSKGGTTSKGVWNITRTKRHLQHGDGIFWREDRPHLALPSVAPEGLLPPRSFNIGRIRLRA